MVMTHALEIEIIAVSVGLKACDGHLPQARALKS
jgi:hypothetical protein